MSIELDIESWLVAVVVCDSGVLQAGRNTGFQRVGVPVGKMATYAPVTV